MLTLDDCNVIEGYDGTEEEDYFASLQRAINAGSWSMPGSYGRAMMEAIENGDCMLGRQRFRDYYGNVIPSRDDVVHRTKGSKGFVADRNGADRADRADFLEAIE